MQNVVTLKLYTDFDDLQWAMKQCFRLETMADTKQEQNEREQKFHRHDQRLREQLETRIEVFFHWRGALMIVLNKFGTRWRDIENTEALFTGINQKMGISSTAAFSFYGPLSTTTSYQVAKGFATEKGMVLKISSRFPRLNYCNAFQASLLSDYPEEQEWLIGHMCLVKVCRQFFLMHFIILFIFAFYSLFKLSLFLILRCPRFGGHHSRHQHQ